MGAGWSSGPPARRWCCSMVLGVFVGGLISKVVSERVIHGMGGVLFIVFGCLMLYSVFKPGPDIAPVIQAAEQAAAKTAGK